MGYLAQNVFAVVQMMTYEPVDEALDAKQLTAWAWTCTILTVTSFVLAGSIFNLTTWYMGFNYHSCAASLRHVWRQNRPPAHFKSRLRYLFWTFFGLNVAAPVMLGVVSFCDTYHAYLGEAPSPWYDLFVSQVAIGGLQAVSFGFLGTALLTIRKHIK